MVLQFWIMKLKMIIFKHIKHKIEILSKFKFKKLNMIKRHMVLIIMNKYLILNLKN